MPAGNKATYANIKEIVDGVCMDLQEGSHRKEQYFHWAIKYVKKWKMDMAKEMKVVQLSLTPWKSIILPDDCIDWIICGVQKGNLIETFVHTKDMALINEIDTNGVKIYNETPSNPVSDALVTDPNTAISWPFTNFTPYGEDPGKLFGLQMKDNGLGYFSESRSQDRQEIQFRTDLPSTTKIYFGYLAPAIVYNMETLVHPYAVDWITAGIHYQRHKHGNKDKGAIKIAKDELDEEIRLLVDRLWDWNVDELLEWLRYNYKMNPKN